MLRVADEEVEKLGLAYIWESRSENGMSWIRKVTRGTCNDMQVQNSFTHINPKNSLLYYCELKQKWCKETRVLLYGIRSDNGGTVWSW